MRAAFSHLYLCLMLCSSILANAAVHGSASQPLRIWPTELTIPAGEAQRILVEQKAPDGFDRDVTSEAACSSDQPGIATVSDGGIVHAKGSGIAVITARIGGAAATVRVRVTDGRGGKLSFVNDVVPLLSRAGCNAGACHAKPAGQAGFKLSVFAYDPQSDYQAIVKEARGRRIAPAAPRQSLLLKKPTMQLEHGGGLRLKEDSDAHQLIVRWIEQGLPYSRPGEPALTGIEVYPKDRLYAPSTRQPLLVRASYSDGSIQDVTHLADFSSNDKSVARTAENGVLSMGDSAGEAVVVARYMGHVDVSHVTIPARRRLPPSFYAALPVNNYIDRLAYQRFQKLGLSPSDLCTDAEFLRRASLDAIGRLPNPDEARGFLADQDPQKRSKLIDRLLEHPSYADYWAGKWADLLRPNPFRAGVKSVYILDQWLRESFRQNKPYDQFVRQILLAEGSTHRYGPAVVFRDRREPADITTLVSQLFLGVRLECAKCHHHPNEKWSQEDFYQFAAFFGQLQRKGQGISAPISGEAEFIWFAPGGNVTHPVSGQAMRPKAPGASGSEASEGIDPRQSLVDWMTQSDNPFFGRATVNRVWAELMGRGFVHPVDDFRVSNPASNGALLDALARDFVEHGYDLKHVMRTIMRSRIYQLSSRPNPQNIADTRNFSRRYRRRPSAEVLLDAVCDVTGVPESLQGLPAGSRAVQTWNYRIDSEFLDAFSRPNASADPPCEREGESSVVQALHLMNSTKLTAKITSDTGRAAVLAASQLSPQQIVTELYLSTYARYPDEDEMKVAVAAFSAEGATRRSATEDILWSLINSAEFVFNH